MFEKLEKPKKAAAAGLAAVALAGFSGRAEASYFNTEVADKTQSAEKQDPYKAARAVLESMNKAKINEDIVCNCAVVFPEGTRVEKAPMSALKYKVPEGKVLLMQRMRLLKHGNVLWAAAWQAHSPWTNQASDAKNYQWVNLTKASKLPGYSVFNYSYYNPDVSRDYPFTFPVKPQKKDNNLMIISPSTVTHSNEIAVPTLEPTDYIQAELDDLNLVPAEKPVRYIKANPVPPINPATAYGP